MKHLLPILTLALIGVVATVSADDSLPANFDNFYYDYYANPGVSGITFDENLGRYTDTVTYSDFAITRVSQDQNNLALPDGSNNTNLYKISISAEKGTQVKLYLTDFVKSLSDTSQSLYNNVSQYGYRILNADGTVADEKYKDMPTADQLTEADIIDGGGLNEWNTVYRYKYELGTFDDGTELEVFMKDRDTGFFAYSYNGLTNGDTLTDKAYGGYGDGGYYYDGASIVVQTDGLLDLYHFGNNPVLDQDHLAKYTDFDDNRDIAANKAKPLARLDISYNRTGVYFGIIGVTVVKDINGIVDGGFGQPLPGGVQLALIAGLFGLGFCYARRRKAIIG